MSDFLSRNRRRAPIINHFRRKRSYKFILECEACGLKKIFTRSDLANKFKCSEKMLSGSYLDNNLKHFKCRSCGQNKIKQFVRSKSENSADNKLFGTFEYHPKKHTHRAEENVERHPKIAEPQTRKVKTYIPDVSNLSSDQVAECPYDGIKFKKGSICPNFYNHKAVADYRKWGKWGSFRRPKSRIKIIKSKG